MKNMSIRNKLLVGILSVTIITMSGLAFLSYHIASKTILQQNEAYISQILQKGVEEMRMLVGERLREISLLSQEQLLLNAFDREGFDLVEKRLASYQKQSPAYEMLFLADAEGQIFMNTQNEKINGFDLTRHPLFEANVQKSQEGRLWFGHAGKSPATGKPICLVTAPVFLGKNVIGILGMTLDLGYFTETMIKKRRFGETGYLVLLNDKGLIIAHPDEKNILVTDVSTLEFGRAMLSQKNGRISYDWHGKEKIAQFAYYADKGWIIMATLEKSELLKDIFKMGWLSFILGLAGIISISAVAWLIIAKNLVKPLDQVVLFVKKVSAGDLSETFEYGREDELGMLLNAMNHMVENLRNVVSNVKTGTDNVAAGSFELSNSSEQLSQGASEQAASSEQVASSVEEMTSNIQQNADNAFETEKIALASARDIEEGGKAVIETVSAMRAIAKKIAVIEEIADKTSMLALNAAIEAARAGTRGRGFAVVASEVRELSKRTQVSAAQISELSASSVETAEKAGDMLSKIVPNIQKTAELVQEISAASKEQSSGAEQISQAIQQLDQVIQLNASSSEEIASTSEEFSGQVEQLRAAMAYFKTSHEAKEDIRPVQPMAWGPESNFGAKAGRGPNPHQNGHRQSGHREDKGEPHQNFQEFQMTQSPDFMDDEFERY